MKARIVCLLLLFAYIHSQCPAAASNFYECTEKNKVNVPLFNGKCCYDSNNKCSFVKTITSIGSIVNEGRKCGTQVEKCLESQPKHVEDKETCIYTQVEAPYKCCFVKYRYFARCFPVDNTHKKEFKKLQYHLRTFYGWVEGGDIEIECSASFYSFSAILLIFLFLF